MKEERLGKECRTVRWVQVVRENAIRLSESRLLVRGCRSAATRLFVVAELPDDHEYLGPGRKVPS